jgi:hypothetical protein
MIPWFRINWFRIASILYIVAFLATLCTPISFLIGMWLSIEPAWYLWLTVGHVAATGSGIWIHYYLLRKIATETLAEALRRSGITPATGAAPLPGPRPTPHSG